MSNSTYFPTVVEATPRSTAQREAAILGHRGFRVSASGNTRIAGLRVTAYLVHQHPDGYLRCACLAGQKGRECCHKQAVRQYLSSPADVPVATQITVAPGPHMTFACARPRFEMTAKERRETAVLVTTGDFSLYRS
jgi:hypothetical protein